ncbi:hypothetical protein [Vibrio metschnikovii]|uniref:hypothetical protein n=1 Tax=Vibrio metschnikovii TaxID=28172 RepID=UPI001C3044D8|nr:hypothetical protein [Vibrio metschnikovii]
MKIANNIKILTSVEPDFDTKKTINFEIESSLPVDSDDKYQRNKPLMQTKSKELLNAIKQYCSLDIDKLDLINSYASQEIINQQNTHITT